MAEEATFEQEQEQEEVGVPSFPVQANEHAMSHCSTDELVSASAGHGPTCNRKHGCAPLQVLDYTEGLEGEEAAVTAEEADAAPVQEVWQAHSASTSQRQG